MFTPTIGLVTFEATQDSATWLIVQDRFFASSSTRRMIWLSESRRFFSEGVPLANFARSVSVPIGRARCQVMRGEYAMTPIPL